jgi:predicted phosphohydrolase
MIIGVASDIHLDHVTIDPKKESKIIRIGKTLTKGLDHLIVAGDVSSFNHLKWHMEALHKEAHCPIHWLMGNHDYWGGSFKEAEDQAKTIKGYIHNKVIELNEETAIIGINSWFDGRLGNVNDLFRTNDYLMIKDFHSIMVSAKYNTIPNIVKNKADKQTELAKKILSDNVGKYKKIYFATHYPAWHNEEDNPVYYPWSVNSGMGNMLIKLAANNPKTNIEVLAGHTHH